MTPDERLALAKRLEGIWNDGYEAAIKLHCREPRDHAYLHLADLIGPALEVPATLTERHLYDDRPTGWLLIHKSNWRAHLAAIKAMIGE